MILGGDHADAPLELGAGSVIADFVVDEDVPVILDLSRFRKGEQVRFMTDFGERLYHRNREPLHLVLDEADAFAPQRPQKGQERMLGAVEDLVRRGRARGIGVTLITQRSAVLNKDVLTQAEVLVAMRVTSPQDRKAVDEWVKLHAGDDHQRDEFLGSLTSLPIGEAWFWSPGWLDIFQRVKVRKRTTFDSSATPKVGQRKVEPKAFAEVDLEALAGRIADSIERAKAEDPKELRRQIADLQKQLRNHHCPEATEQRVEVPILDAHDSDRLNETAVTVEASARLMDAIATKLVEAIGQEVHKSWRPTRDTTSPPPKAPHHREHQGPPLRPSSAAAVDDVYLKAGARRIVEALAHHYPMKFTRAQLGTLTGFKITGGTFQTYWSQIKRAGLTEEADGLIWASDAGIDFAGVEPGAPSSTAEILDMWRSKLKAGARNMLDALVDAYPNPLSKESLGVEVNMEPSGGTFQTYVSTLRRNGLIEVDGDKLRASDSLFLREGR